MTKIVTNSKAIADKLEKYQCDGLHRHVALESGRPKACERYPGKFCQVILEAFKTEMATKLAGSQDSFMDAYRDSSTDSSRDPIRTITQNDEFGEPFGEPCRASCGCMGACDEQCRRSTIVRRARSQGTVISISGETWPLPPEEEAKPP